MTLRQYLRVMILATILCWFALGMVIINIDPFATGESGFFFFYASLFLSLVGTLSLVIFLLYHWFNRSSLPLYRYVQKSFRDGMGGAAGLILLLFLQGHGLLRVWNVVLFAVVLIGVLLLSRAKPQSTFADFSSQDKSFK